MNRTLFHHGRRALFTMMVGLLAPACALGLNIRFLPRAQDAEIVDPGSFPQLTIVEAGESTAGLAEPVDPPAPDETTVPGGIAPPGDPGASAAASEATTATTAEVTVDLAPVEATPPATGEIVVEPTQTLTNFDEAQLTAAVSDLVFEGEGFVFDGETFFFEDVPPELAEGPGLVFDEGEGFVFDEGAAFPFEDVPGEFPLPPPPPLLRSGTGSAVKGFSAFPETGTASEKTQLHLSVRETGGFPDIAGDVSRSTKDRDDNLRSDVAVTYDGRTRRGVQFRNQLAFRVTDDTEVFGTGNRFRVEGSFLEAARPGQFLLRAGDILPQFSTYSLAHNADGLFAVQEFPRARGSTQVQVTTGRTVREQTPGVFRRHATGVRVANLWQLGRRSRLQVGGQLVHLKEFESSITEAPTVAVFPNDDIGTVNMAFDDGNGLAAEAEWGGSTSESFAMGLRTPRRGYAGRQALSWARDGRSIVVEHERVEPTFDSPDSAATPDLDRQTVAFTVPFGAALSFTGNFNRVLNDIRRLQGRSIDNKTWRLGVQARPWSDPKANRWLRGLSLGGAGQLVRNEASDRSTNTLVREYTASVSENVGRLTLSYELRDAVDADLMTPENGRLPQHSTYQAGYEFAGGKRRPWRLSPFFNLGHDHDRILRDGAIDRGNQLSFGANGSVGSRNNFSLARDEIIQRFVSQTRQSLARMHRFDWNYVLDPVRGTQASLQLLDSQNEDTTLAALTEQRAQVSIFQRW